MKKEIKPMVSKEETFDLLEMRVGQVLGAELEPHSSKKAFRLTVDFGKFGVKTSVGRFTQHQASEIVGMKVIGVLNFPSRQVGETVSEVLILGVQFPKAESGEATFISPVASAKIGGKLF